MNTELEALPAAQAIGLAVYTIRSIVGNLLVTD